MHLVLLPGMDGTGSPFSHFVSALEPDLGATVIHYPTDQALGYTELENIAARSSLPREQPFIILGESFSGPHPIAISLAASMPPGLVGIVLCCSFARNPLPIFGVFKSLLGLVPFHLLPKMFLHPFLLGRFSSRTSRSEFGEAISRVSDRALRARFKAIIEVDVSAKLQQIAVPVLYLRASKDHLVPRSAAEHVRRVAPRVRVVELEAPHLLLQAVPSTAASVIREFSHHILGAGT
jgi:pimeloyl-ACP methyl ester carboxylesterase